MLLSQLACEHNSEQQEALSQARWRAKTSTWGCLLNSICVPWHAHTCLHTSTHKSNTYSFLKNTHIMELSSRRPRGTITINPLVFFSTAIPLRAILEDTEEGPSFVRVIMSWVIPFRHFIGGTWVHIGASVAQKPCLFLASLTLSEGHWPAGCYRPRYLFQQARLKSEPLFFTDLFPNSTSLSPHLHLSLFLKKIYFSFMCECMCMCVDACGSQKKPYILKLKF